MTAVEIRVGAPDGPLLARSGPEGRADTGPWIFEPTTFYMQDVSNGQPLTAEHTLATVRVDVPATSARGWSLQRALVAARFWWRAILRKLHLSRQPIRLVFLAQDPLDWFSLQSVYAACAADPRFEAHVVNAGFHHGAGDCETDCEALFRQLQIPFMDGRNGETDLRALRPDLVALSSPYDQNRPPEYGTRALVRYTRTIFIPYCIDYADPKGTSGSRGFGMETHRRAWRIFSRSPRTIANYRRYGGIPARRVVCLGHPRLDQLFSATPAEGLPPAIASAGEGKFKIIYAPHHSVDGWSTFRRYATDLRRLVEGDPDCYLVFRPHPLLKATLAHAGVMSEQDFNAICQGPQCCLYEGLDYWSLFRWSDLLLSDGSSFLVEYAPTRKPIVYLHRQDGREGLDETLQEDVYGSCYVAESFDDIRRFVRQLKGGDDPLARTRERFQEQMSAGMFTGGAGQRVADYLRRTLS